jgi:hypothetical protein
VLRSSYERKVRKDNFHFTEKTPLKSPGSLGLREVGCHIMAAKDGR